MTMRSSDASDGASTTGLAVDAFTATEVTDRRGACPGRKLASGSRGSRPSCQPPTPARSPFTGDPGGSKMRIQIVAAVVLAVSLFAVAPSSARTERPPAAVALAWNANAVAAVRAASVIDPQGTAARPLYQTEGLLYMSYVQAAVYDAATKIGHRYAPYHHFSAAAGNASLEAR